jgi:glycosyltransferase involved in cell wall biosynthesis
MEYRHLRDLGMRQPIAVIPNGVALPEARDAGAVQVPSNPECESGRHARSHSRASRGLGEPSRVALLLSRVHPKKGLLELVRAWARVAPPGWRLWIAGPDEGGHWAEVAHVIAELGLDSSVHYLGPVEAGVTSALYQQADLFILPTFSENFGLVVAEALAHGVPVITTRGAPWADLETFGCGWWIDTGVEPLALALRAATSLSDAERAAMGERGRIYVRRYDWDAIATEMVAVYRWVLGLDERPACVRVD